MVMAVFLLCCLFGLRCPITGANKLLVGLDLSEKILASWRVHASEYSSELLLPVSLMPKWDKSPPLTPAEHPPLLAGWSAPVSYMVTAFSPCPCVHKTLCMPFKNGSSVSQSCGISVIKPCWSSKPDSLMSPLCIARCPGWVAWHGAQYFHSFRRTSKV